MRIVSYTRNTWGEDQAARYFEDLEACCQMLAEKPELGRACDQVRPGLRRLEHGRHVVFYRKRQGGILISRILHQRMLPGRQRFGDQKLV
jgi:toxin ParE1/3/4